MISGSHPARSDGRRPCGASHDRQHPAHLVGHRAGRGLGRGLERRRLLRPRDHGRRLHHGVLALPVRRSADRRLPRLAPSRRHDGGSPRRGRRGAGGGGVLGHRHDLLHQRAHPHHGGRCHRDLRRRTLRRRDPRLAEARRTAERRYARGKLRGVARCHAHRRFGAIRRHHRRRSAGARRDCADGGVDGDRAPAPRCVDAAGVVPVGFSRGGARGAGGAAVRADWRGTRRPGRIRRAVRADIAAADLGHAADRGTARGAARLAGDSAGAALGAAGLRRGAGVDDRDRRRAGVGRRDRRRALQPRFNARPGSACAQDGRRRPGRRPVGRRREPAPRRAANA